MISSKPEFAIRCLMSHFTSDSSPFSVLSEFQVAKTMAVGILYTFTDPSVESQIVLSTAAFADIDLDRVIIKYGEERGEAFLKKFPSGKVPAFEQNGFYLTGGTAIAYYLARLKPECGLVPSDMQNAALVDQWISFAEHELDMKIHDLDDEHVDIQVVYVLHLMENSQWAMICLRKHFTMRLYILGVKLSLADIVITSVLTYGLHEPGRFNLHDYCQRVIEHPKLALVFSERSLRPEPAAYIKAKAMLYPNDNSDWEDKSQAESESLYQDTWRWAI